MELTILGAGNPDPSPDRYGSAFLLEIADDRLLIDCGPATTYKLARAGYRPTQVDRLFFTHHHFDHNADYPCFLLTHWDQCGVNASRLKVIGPEPTELITERLIGKEGAFYHDWYARVEHPVSQRMFTDRGGILPRPAPDVDVREVDDGDVIEGEAWTAKVSRLTHAEPYLISVGYRFESDDGVVAIVNDAGPNDALVSLARNADVVVIACAFDADYAGSHPEVPPMITGTEDAGRMAHSAGAKLAVLVHCNRGVVAPERRERAISEVARHFDGRIILADELMKLTI